MYIEAVPNRHSPPAILLRESYRENGKVRKRTLCNLSDWPAAHIEGVVEAALALAKDGTRMAIADIATAARALRGHPHDAVTAEFHRVIARYSSMGDDIDRRAEKAGRPTEDYRPSRLRSIEELPLALGYALLHGGDFRPTVEDGVNSGRDTESIGCMSGAILGALQGTAVLAPSERALLDEANRTDLAAEADAFAGAASAILRDDAERMAGVAAARAALGLACLRPSRRRWPCRR